MFWGPSWDDRISDGGGWERRAQSVVATYTFGDDWSAARRLELVASAYEPVSRAFLAEHGTRDAGVAIDLGCGPGFSTRLVGEVCGPSTLIGLDASAQFLEEARTNVPAARFETCDVSRPSLPGAPADVVYARLVLAHLPDPPEVAARWTAALTPRGVLLIEDLEAIDAPPGPLRTYDDISADVVRLGGGVMYAGADLARLGGRCTDVTVPAALAASIYLFNVRRWLADPSPPVPRDRLVDVEDGLTAIAADDGGATVSWIVRQLVLRRDGRVGA